MKLELEYIINKTANRICLLCETNLDEDIGDGKWHVPLCTNHRRKYLEKINNQKRKKTKEESCSRSR